MRLHLERASRVPRAPAWALALAGAFGGLVLLGVLLERRLGLPMDTCYFHRLTGHPCPTCGSTRAVLALASGQWEGAFHLNPLVTAALLAGGILLALRFTLALAPRLEASPAERRGLLAAGLLALALNWAWVLRTLA